MFHYPIHRLLLHGAIHWDPIHGPAVESLLLHFSVCDFEFPIEVQTLSVIVVAQEPQGITTIAGYLQSESAHPVGVFAMSRGGALPFPRVEVAPNTGRDPIRAIRAKSLRGGAIDRSLLKRGSQDPVHPDEWRAAIHLFRFTFPESFRVFLEPSPAPLPPAHVRRFHMADRATLAYTWDILCASLDVAIQIPSAHEIAVISGPQLF